MTTTTSYRSDDAIPRALRVTAGVSWRALVIIGLVAIVGYVLGVLYLVTLPLAVSLIVCTLTVPPTRALQRRGLPAGGAAAVVVIGGLAAIIGLLSLLAPSFVQQISELGPSLEAARDNLFTFLEDGPLNLSQERLQEMLDQVGSTTTSSGVVGRVLSGTTLVVEALAALALVLVLTFFFTKDGEELVDWFIARTPARHRDLLRALGERGWTALSGYVRGTAIIALIDAVAIAIGLAIIGVPLVLPIGVLVFLGAFLPVVGAFLSGTVGVLVALADGGARSALLALAVVLAVQQLEGNVLHPTIMRRSVNLHPVVVLSALTAGAAVAGIAGAFLSVPLTAVIAAVANELRVRAERPGDQGPEPVTGYDQPDRPAD